MHKIPFYPAAPTSSFDIHHKYHQITIEERNIDELVRIKGIRIVPKAVNILNPAFDITPPDLISGIVTNRGILTHPLEKDIEKKIRPHL